MTVHVCYSDLMYVICLQVKKGVKRKADTTTPTTPISGMVEPIPIVKAKAAKIPTRRESTRTVKKPNRDLPEDPQAVSGILKVKHNYVQGLYGSLKSWKVQEFCCGIF